MLRQWRKTPCTKSDWQRCLAAKGFCTCGVSQTMPSVKTRGRRSSVFTTPPPAVPLASVPAARDSIDSSSSAARSISSKLWYNEK